MIEKVSALGLVVVSLVLGTPGGADGFEASFWVWHRLDGLAAGEVEELRESGVRQLYWHVGDLGRQGAGWAGTLRPVPEVDGIEVVPVVRLRAEAATVEAAEAFGALAAQLAGYCEAEKPGEIQIDYDCPDRLLGNYARLLGEIREAVAPVAMSATALAGWSRLPEIGQVLGAVDAVHPMFYDLAPDTADALRPLAEVEEVGRRMGQWGTVCRAAGLPWFAGLPNFSRMTVYGGDGRSRGHLRSWDWDGIIFHPMLLAGEGPGEGVVVLEARADCIAGGTRLEEGETLVWRRPELAALRALASRAEALGAAGVNWFRLPGRGAGAGWSVRELAGGAGADLGVAVEGQRIVLRNRGSGGVPPRFRGRHGPLDRGWQLEIDARGRRAFADVAPGGFVRVAGHRDPDAPEPVPVPTALATRLTFWFGSLAAGDQLASGIFLLGSGAAPEELRWRVDGGSWEAVEEIDE